MKKYLGHGTEPLLSRLQFVDVGLQEGHDRHAHVLVACKGDRQCLRKLV